MTKRRVRPEADIPEGAEVLPRKKPLKPLTAKQKDLLNALRASEQTVALGPAGTGKTYLPACYAADRFAAKEIKKIVLTRPNVPSGRSIGFFPGDLNEKMAPWCAEFLGVVKERLGVGAFEYALNHGQIEIVPFEVMRGRSFPDSFIMLDEAQNTTPNEIKMFLTRTGERSQVLINGDLTQSDVGMKNGLAVALNLIRAKDLPVTVVEFTLDDIVRSGLCAMWVRAFYGEPA